MQPVIEQSPPTGQEWGRFIAPDPGIIDVENPHERLGVPIFSGYRAPLTRFAGADPLFDHIALTIKNSGLICEDQCSEQHYFDVFRCLERCRDEVTRVVEVGVYMGGASAVFAGCVQAMGIGLDLVDINPSFLRFTYERLRRTFPEALPSVRMFHGDLPTYVRDVLLAEEGERSLVHHDGSHQFHQVVKDLASLYYARDRVHALAIQDTHLRCDNVEDFTFVDAAVHAVFGGDLRAEPLGAVHPEGSPLTNPNVYQGNYFLPGVPEGLFIPLAENTFSYPHPTMTLDRLLPKQSLTT